MGLGGWGSKEHDSYLPRIRQQGKVILRHKTEKGPPPPGQVPVHRMTQQRGACGAPHPHASPAHTSLGLRRRASHRTEMGDGGEERCEGVSNHTRKGTPHPFPNTTIPLFHSEGQGDSLPSFHVHPAECSCVCSVGPPPGPLSNQEETSGHTGLESPGCGAVPGPITLSRAAAKEMPALLLSAT